MKTRPAKRTTAKETGSVGEILILADGKILAHNISPVLAGVLTRLNPTDQAMQERAKRKKFLKHELPK